MSAILLFIIAAAAPWVVHLAPPRQRFLALILVLAVFLLYWIFAKNPLTSWALWAGLAAGIVSALLAAGALMGRRGGRGRGRRRPRARGHSPLEDPSGEPTGEI
jgi:H+/Cl- antiporter ClcA